MRIKLSDHFTYKKLLKFTMPSILMMVFTSVYGMVDGFFVSNFAGKTPFAAVNLIFPLLMILATVGFIFGTGGTAIVAKTLGEGDKKRANEYFSLFVLVTLFLGVLFAVIGIIFARPLSIMLGANGELLECSVLYARVILLALPFFCLQLLFQSFFVTAEKPGLGFTITLIAGVTNMVLDAVLVGFLPLEHKLLGAAIATGVSQIVGGLVPIIYFLRKNDSILRIVKTKFYGNALVKAVVNGSSEFMSNVSMNLVGMLYNIQLLKYAGESGVASYGVMMYISFMFASAFIGYSIGVAPVVGFNYGAKRNKELKEILIKSLIITAFLSLIMLLSGELLAKPLAFVFVGYEEELISLTVSGFRIFALSFAFMGFAIFSSGFFTALSNGLISALVSFLRTLVFQAGAVLLLPLIFGIEGIWWSVVVAEFMATVLGVIFIILKRKKYGY